MVMTGEQFSPRLVAFLGLALAFGVEASSSGANLGAQLSYSLKTR
jgi:hypothetical protein